jgi:hypothetical protein
MITIKVDSCMNVEAIKIVWNVLDLMHMVTRYGHVTLYCIIELYIKYKFP